MTSVDVTDARYGPVLNEKQPTANQCDGLYCTTMRRVGRCEVL